MSSLNKGSSIYHEIQALYWRSHTGQLLAVEGRGQNARQVQNAWADIWPKVETNVDKNERVMLPQGGWLQVTSLTPSHCHSEESSFASSPELPPLLHKDCKDAHLEVHEMQRPDEDNIVGAVSVVSEESKHTSEFRNWFYRFILSETQFMPVEQLKEAGKQNSEATEMAQRITTIFEKDLRNIASNDQWIAGEGREYFLNRVFGFTQKGATVQLCLPAFPCKSSNRQKTNGAAPDRAEEIALRALLSFTRHVAAVYEPGAKISIISDGHVFSDCIGVDDDMVDQYSEQLQAMAQRLVERPQDEGAIDFVSLWDIFFSNPEMAALFNTSFVEHVDLTHFVQTKLDENAELCRRMLMASCQIGSDVLSNLIKGGDESTVALYRGFSRFMLEDLAVHPSCMEQSASKRKKLATKVAAEMIQRNQAYSNLVELVYPSHLRLSIHAHDNRGPKFGVRLFPYPSVRAIKSLADREEPPTQELLHIPTPWHNCIIEIKGDPTLYLTKSRVALEALENNHYKGSWTSSGGTGGGKCFSMSQVRPTMLGGTRLRSQHRL